MKILIVEDLPDYRAILRAQLESHGYTVEEAPNLETARGKLEFENYDVILLDLKLPDGNGLRLLDRFPAKLSGRTVVMTANATIPGVVEAIKKGAFNYLEKPVDPELLLVQVRKLQEVARIQAENQSLKTEVKQDYTFDSIIAHSKEMQDVVYRAQILATTENTILIEGETGVGKEVLSHAIHNASLRHSEIFLPINCASIPTELFESELFGFEKGAFTGAVDSYRGRFVQADKGSLFLDEIGELPLHIQAKLLRILDEKVIYRLKSSESQRIDVRLIAATNRNLLEEIDLKQFRKDLFYRLRESAVLIPPLRERMEDILPLARYFIKIFNEIYNKDVASMSNEVEHFFLNYPWNGNVRELKNTIKSIIPFKRSPVIELDDLSYSVVMSRETPASRYLTLEEFDSRYIQKILKIVNFNISRAAEILDISRPRIYRIIKELKIKGVSEQ